ncbi:DUF6299 family protein, partial [Streptomyces tendae]
MRTRPLSPPQPVRRLRTRPLSPPSPSARHGVGGTRAVCDGLEHRWVNTGTPDTVV